MLLKDVRIDSSSSTIKIDADIALR